MKTTLPSLDICVLLIFSFNETMQQYPYYLESQDLELLIPPTLSLLCQPFFFCPVCFL